MNRGKNNKQSKKKNTKKREVDLFPALKILSMEIGMAI